MKKLLLTLTLLLTPIATATEFGIGNESNICRTCIMPPQLYPKLHDMNVKSVRYFVYWCFTNPAPDVYDFSQTDEEIDRAEAAGIPIYVDFMWAPPWASEGKPTYMPYTAGCSAWNDPRDGSKGIRFAYEYDYCVNPPHIDSAALQKYVKKFIERYGHRVQMYGIWNEPDFDFYWAPRLPGDDRPADYDRFIREVWVPFVQAVREAKPDAVIIGPESGGLQLQQYYSAEQQYGMKFFDIVSVHLYPWNEEYPGAMIKRFKDQFIPDITKDGRPYWISETNSNLPADDPNYGASLEPFFEQLRTVYPAPRMVIFHVATAFFDKNYNPNDAYYIFKAAATPPAKRRAVGRSHVLAPIKGEENYRREQP